MTTAPKKRVSPNDALALAKRYEREERPADALDIFRQIAGLAKAPLPVLRDTVAGLERCGDRVAAASLSRRINAALSEGISGSVEQAFKAVESQLDQVRIHPKLLDWAWERLGHGGPYDRTEWERRMRWGVAADNLCFLWCEAGFDDADAGKLFYGFDEWVDEVRETQLGPILYATAHVGPIFAGLLSMRLIGGNAFSVGSYPSLKGSVLAPHLISTSTNSRDRVRALVEEELATKARVTIVPDGNRDGPMLDPADGDPGFRVSPLVPRLVHRLGVPSVYSIMEWRERQVHFRYESLPEPQDGESEDEFVQRWRLAYRGAVLRQIRTEPENLRLQRGLWRDIAEAL